MTQTEWAPLPNAKHIDWVIASLNTNPEKWSAAWDAASWTAVWYAAYYAARVAAYDIAWAAAWDAANNAARVAAYDMAWDAALDAARYAADDAIIALITYDDCAYMVESDIDEIKILAKLGDQRALLLLPACIVFNETKELTSS